MPNIKKVKTFNNIKKLTFYVISFLFLLSEYLPISSNIFNIVKPHFATAFIFFFYIYKNQNISYFFIFIISLIYDSLTNYYVGSTAICFFLVLTIFNYQKKLFLFDDFKELWLAYALFFVEFIIIKIILIYYVNMSIINFGNLLISSFFSILFYPILHNLLFLASSLLNNDKPHRKK